MIFFDRRGLEGTKTGLRLGRSVDGGRTFVNHEVKQESFEFQEGVFFGDYSGIDAHGGLVVAMYPHFVGNRKLAISAAVFRFDPGTQQLRTTRSADAKSAATAPPDEPAEKSKEAGVLALTNVTVVDVIEGKSKPNQTVVVDGNKIVTAGSDTDVNVPANSRKVDASGKFLIPGLWDMHTHIGGPDYLPLFIANGVTGVRELHAFYPDATFAPARRCPGRQAVRSADCCRRCTHRWPPGGLAGRDQGDDPGGRSSGRATTKGHEGGFHQGL